MSPVASYLMEEVSAHAQSDSLEDAQMVLTYRITYVLISKAANSRFFLADFIHGLEFYFLSLK